MRGVEVPSCPRCGYDLTGIVDSWEETCPIEGVCSECGLAIQWQNVLREDRQRLPWFFEHTPRRRLGYVRAWKTWFRTLLPGSFWKVVGLHHTTSVVRMVFWLLVLIVPLHAVGAGAADLSYELRIAAPGARFINSIHLERASHHMSFWTEPLVHPGAFSDFTFGYSRRPFFVRPIVAIVFVIPIVLFLLPVTRKRAKVRVVHLVRATIYSFAWLVPLAMVRCVDLTMGAARQTWLVQTGSAASYYNGVLPLGWANRWALWIMVILLFWIGSWWWFVIGRGLKLQQPRLTWFVLMVIASLVAVIILIGDRSFLFSLL